MANGIQQTGAWLVLVAVVIWWIGPALQDEMGNVRRQMSQHWPAVLGLHPDPLQVSPAVDDHGEDLRGRGDGLSRLRPPGGGGWRAPAGGRRLACWDSYLHRAVDPSFCNHEHGGRR
jgi:hypothetical protein